ncbi:DedA family protein [Flaviaesturariibacter aridisoli]|uniref:DedA family protein n=1 Tax=Flaviaesturariibacter aridisoli TaxID=2545761 RepID=A0A4R4E0M1_9BACT|nr:VTT domain-containing protein [Flaviaesturariibacter aridisoli]TCZ72919.1 DedA family protein [Flaviaesturariibacter aridisoli]
MLNNLIHWIIENGGLYILLFVIFAETGLFVGFFLPGDSLLFTAGIYISKFCGQIGDGSVTAWKVALILFLVVFASVLGNVVGYWFGRKTGPLIYERKESWLFRKKHLLRAQEFYTQNGKGTIFLAKFLPIIRTFAPIIAGIVRMDRGTFMLYNLLGSLAWVCSMMLGGYFLESWVSSRFGFSLAAHIEMIAIIIILITTLPVIWKLFFARKKVVPNSPNDPNSVL